jgi:hypothetical protein
VKRGVLPFVRRRSSFAVVFVVRGAMLLSMKKKSDAEAKKKQ